MIAVAPGAEHGVDAAVTGHEVVRSAIDTLSSEIVARAGMVDLDVTFFVQTVFFLLLVLILPRLIFEPLLKRFEQRDARTSGARTDARRMLKEADEQVHVYQKATSDEKQKALAERAAARDDAKHQADEMVKKVRMQTVQAVAIGVAALRKEADKARTDIDHEAAAISVMISTKILGGSSNDDAPAAG